MTNQWSILKKIPPVHNIKISSGIDRYGFSTVLAKKCGLNYVPRSFANWIHGWIWADNPTVELLLCGDLPRDTSVVVRNSRERDALFSAGFKNITIGGLPFAYIDQQHVCRGDDALLAFPPHSTEKEKLKKRSLEYFDYLESLKGDFSDIYVSVYWSDFNSQLHLDAESRGLKILQGANPNDANSLYRMRYILDSFKYVTTNIFGSHVLYALYAGCNVSICGPLYKFDNIDFQNDSGRIYSDSFTGDSIEIMSAKYIRDRFSEMFVEHPDKGIQNISFAAESIGERFVLQPKDIVHALGWSFMGQISGYSKGAGRRISRLFRYD